MWKLTRHCLQIWCRGKERIRDQSTTGGYYVMSKLFRLSALAVVLALVSIVTVDGQEKKKKGPKGDIVEVAVAGKFTKLVAAVQAAGLVETLKGEGPFTVFAPTDKAFEALGEETLNAVLKDKEKLKKILTYHVVAGKVMAKDAIALAKDNKSAKTVQGGEIALSLEGEGKAAKLKLNGKATVIKPNVQATNGVIHVIDAVILPKE
jgi:uncharacterized surface protein with fasciclin (FAS1) repeats